MFQTLFQLRNFPGRVAELAGHPVERVEFEEVVAKTDMTLEITETDAGLMCRFEYPVALFDEATIARMAGHWRTLLEDIVADPSKEVSRLRILTEVEHRDLLALGRGPRREYPRDATVDGIFEARARESPDSIAIIDGRSASPIVSWMTAQTGWLVSSVAWVSRQVSPSLCSWSALPPW